jgi:hypothetical protein
VRCGWHLPARQGKADANEPERKAYDISIPAIQRSGQGDPEKEQDDVRSGQPRAEAEEAAEPAAAADPPQSVDDSESSESSERSSGTDAAEAQEASEASEASETEEAAGTEEEAAPPKKRKALVLSIAAAVVVLGVGGGLAYWYFWSDSAQSVAEDYVALQNKEVQDPHSVTAESYRPVVCDRAMPAINELQMQKQQFLAQATPADLGRIKQVKMTLKNVEAGGDSGRATVETTAPGQQSQTADLNLIKQNGEWRLCA